MITYSTSVLPGSFPAELTDVIAGLERVRAKLWAVVVSDSPIVMETSRHLIGAGGKLFRPLLTLSAAIFGGCQSDQVIDAAVVCELTHLASMHHDDVIDEDVTRRGVPTVNARWGNSIAILTGDYLLAVAAQLCVRLGPEAQELHAMTARRLVTGQISEVIGPAAGADPIEHYMSVVRDKTAALIALSARLGALLGGNREMSEVLALYGERLGVAFQIANDLSDLLPAASGRTAGNDLRRGLETLPVLYARRYARPTDSQLLDLLDGDFSTAGSVAGALELLKVHPGFAFAQADLLHMLKECNQALSALPPCPTKSALLAMTRAICTPGVEWPVITSPSRREADNASVSPR